jgi:hypothetical protein
MIAGVDFILQKGECNRRTENHVQTDGFMPAASRKLQAGVRLCGKERHDLCPRKREEEEEDLICVGRLFPSFLPRCSSLA